MGQTSLMTGGTNKKLQTAGGKRALIQVAQCDQGSLFSHILKILGAFATVYSQYRALHWYTTATNTIFKRKLKPTNLKEN